MKSYNKKYSFSAIIAMIIINGCNSGMIPFKGKYGTSSLEITSTKSFDTIWLNFTHLFAANGLFVKNIEKKKGWLSERNLHLFLFILLKIKRVNYKSRKPG